MIHIENKATKIGDLEVYERTPFMDKLVNEMRNKKTILARGEQVFENGLPTGTTFLGITEEVDSNQFIKVFTVGLKMMFDLSKSDMKVFTYIMSLTMMKSDKINFIPAQCIKSSGLSRASVVRAVINLANAGIIAKTDVNNVYWINPTVFFRGDRMVLVREYRKKKSDDFQARIQQDGEFDGIVPETANSGLLIPQAAPPEPDNNED